MATTLYRTTERPRPEISADRPGDVLTKVLLACGVAYSVLYVVLNDVIAATLYEGYSRTSQAVSELSATGAPTKGFLTAVLPLSTAVMTAFGVGVWRSARGRRALRVTGALLVAHALTFPLWLFAPMTSREEMVQGTMPANDLGHIVLTAATILFILGEIGFGAAAFGRRFRIYSIATAATVLIFGALTGVESAKVPTGDPTPWMGLFERISIGPWLLWLAVFAVALLRARSGRPSVPDTPAELVETA
ncbi:MAG TPA: DUF998 domain-containing protein [Actinomycetota bacterium]